MDQQHLVHLLNQRVRYINKSLNETLKQYGLYSAQWSILFCLVTNGSMTQTEISNYLNVEKPTVTRTLKRMEASGWVEKAQGKDKRELLVGLTDMAEMKYEEIKEVVSIHDQEILTNLTEGERETLYNILLKLG
ncbi:MarR family winged helix-turn-helix transcriptional regulator [Aquibacillus sediminis]|uniref:MarR family winged helix-turn-helix transcriptional regulator n=1 Tax=Aquibacillus sediminis TaxID=2574734 RepID=UPI00110816DF|nr:MarR family transcriptional regulator [Aquibacillus sediminis]